MKFSLKILFFIFLILLQNCSGKKDLVDKNIIEENRIDTQMIEAYKKGLEELNKGDALLAAKMFNEAELLYPQSIWAPRSSLMSAYSYYSQNYFDDAIFELERYLKTYPNHNRIDYAYYMLAMCHYDQIVDEKKDIRPILESKKFFNIITSQYPNSEFSLDANYKIDLINELMASKEIYLANYYIKKEKWIPAINRFKVVLKDYSNTIFIEEAIHRLVELHYNLGMEEEAKKYAVLLGYNYKSSEWYEKSYKLFNKSYVKRSIKESKKNKKSILKKIKSLLK